MAEQKALKEKQAIEQKRKELEEERQMLELQRLQEVSGGRKRVDRVEWMYSAPGAAGAGGNGVSEEMESYLLGKRRIDELFRGKDPDTEKVKKDGDMFTQQNVKVNSARDAKNKVFDDPLLAIKRQEQAQYEELMNNPLKLKALRDAKRKREHTNHRHRSRSPDRDGRSHRSHHRHVEEDHRRYEDREDRHSYSRRRDEDDEGHVHRAWEGDRDRRRRVDNGDDVAAVDKAARLAEMQGNATSLDQQRRERLIAQDKMDKLNRERDEAMRKKTAARGPSSKGDFIMKAQRDQLGTLGLGDRIGRLGGRGLVRD